MQPEDRDAAYLWDMLEAAREARAFTAGVDLQRYRQDRMLQLAVERCVEIIGEAARHMSEGFRELHPEIPWRSIIGQRNVLAYEYGEVRQDIMWTTVTTRVPDLIVRLEPLLPPPPEIEA